MQWHACEKWNDKNTSLQHAFSHLAYLEHLFMLLDLDLYTNTLHTAKVFYLHASFFSTPVFCTFFLWLCIGFVFPCCINPIHFFSRFILLAYSWFTMLCKFQVYNKVIQLYILLISIFFRLFCYSLLQEISPGISLEGMMLMLKLQYFGHLIRRVDSLEKTDAGRNWGQEKGTTEDEMAGWTRWMWVWVNSGSWWWTGRPGMLRFTGSQRVGHDWATELNRILTLVPCFLQ